MSAAAWQYRRRGKRFEIELKRALKQIKANPDLVVHLEEFNLAVMSPERYEHVTCLLDKVQKAVSRLSEESSDAK